MAPSKTRTIKNKHASNGSGIKNSKNAAKNASAVPDGIVRKSKDTPKGTKPLKAKGKSNLDALLKKRKKKVYTEAELDIPKLNMVTPAGVAKPKGKKKGKVFVDDRESMTTILAMVQAEKEGQIESKMMKARQMEEIREARRVEAEKKDEERKSKLEDTKDSLRKKRKRATNGKPDTEENVNHIAISGSRAAKPKKKKSVSFA
ncbi:60S ribosomal subunit assembly/export protein loc-1 [Colletotrichum higginsianum]|uniref:60S ribosomal subunit assembly/export protein loc-1 n=4 Tax=Colletotrichum destructivum species complex TaxID=2707350 RepID=H1VND1_COLHI|nr:60S ribosomal subunit assembly/export protein loc-1 [Colletotrichum higginsianum IMI 349063]TIC98908.1 60S ribosomal subunit assembly/export protein loc-1 [Colletotrichum higginsianum]WQF79781.1 Putative 60S ribosomal subunit assembly/export protein Loc1 [Colletotrichum destructivum]OBR11959.1 60S ribosomal subunit assembly/export protein loc-1 [Colletotrichum higginsianum IMI 349063]CCF41735.1 60S ribosomal subunit assembly/export protein loc-1 [Colletotrichum higginsianum]GJC93635.1 60S r